MACEGVHVHESFSEPFPLLSLTTLYAHQPRDGFVPFRYATLCLSSTPLNLSFLPSCLLFLLLSVDSCLFSETRLKHGWPLFQINPQLTFFCTITPDMHFSVCTSWSPAMVYVHLRFPHQTVNPSPTPTPEQCTILPPR